MLQKVNPETAEKGDVNNQFVIKLQLKLKIFGQCYPLPPERGDKKIPRKIQSQNRIAPLPLVVFCRVISPKMNSVSKEPEITKKKTCIASEVIAKTVREPHGCEKTD